MRRQIHSSVFYKVGFELWNMESLVSLRKGQRGRLAVIGGSEEYTGAPYFVATTAEKMGVDLVYIFCHPAASVPLKCYSPTFIVNSLFKETPWGEKDKDLLLQKIKRMDAVVLGPGCGTSIDMINVAQEIITFTKNEKILLVADADTFRLPYHIFQLLIDHPCCIMTPNSVEFEKIEKTIELLQFNCNRNVDEKNYQVLETIPHCPPQYLICETEMGQTFEPVPHEYYALIQRAINVMKFLRVSTLLLKGKYDIIINNNMCVLVTVQGCKHRCGGQGDILSGAVAAALTFLTLHPLTLPTLNHLSNPLNITVSPSVRQEIRDTMITAQYNSISTSEHHEVSSTFCDSLIYIDRASIGVRQAAYRTEQMTTDYISAVDILKNIGTTFRNFGTMNTSTKTF